MEILVYPIKVLYQVLAQAPENAVAIVSSAYEVEEEKLTVPHIVEIYEDLDREVPGRCISQEAADRIGDFIRMLDPAVKTVYCACNMGQCRSTAVAAAVHLYFGLDDMHIWENPAYQPNPLVFQKLCRALRIPMGDELLDLRLETNHYAFRRAIRKQ